MKQEVKCKISRFSYNFIYGKWWHDEKFTKGKKQFPLPTTMLDYAIQSADYMASRVELTGFAFRPTDNVSIPLIETNNL